MSNPNYPEGVTEKDIDNIGEPIGFSENETDETGRSVIKVSYYIVYDKFDSKKIEDKILDGLKKEILEERPFSLPECFWLKICDIKIETVEELPK